MRTPCVLLVVCLSSVSIGCGDDEDGDARPRYRSGVTPMTSTTTVSTLDEADKEQLCASLDAHVQANVSFDAIARISCLPAAIVLGGSPQGCQAQLDQCIDAFPPPIAI